MDLTITIPDENWDGVVSAYRSQYSDTDTPAEDLMVFAIRAYVKDTWLGWALYQNQISASPQYDQAAQAYNDARAQIDAAIAASGEQIQEVADAAFPGI